MSIRTRLSWHKIEMTSLIRNNVREQHGENIRRILVPFLQHRIYNYFIMAINMFYISIYNKKLGNERQNTDHL